MSISCGAMCHMEQDFNVRSRRRLRSVFHGGCYTAQDNNGEKPMTTENRRARRERQFGPQYQWRNLPCTIQPDDKLWCVSGQSFKGSGVLEWCYDEADAQTILSQMRRSFGFRGLRAHPYVETARQ